MKKGLFALIHGGALLLGLLTGFLGLSEGWTWLAAAADKVAELFLRLLQLVGLPIIFFAITSTMTSISQMSLLRSLGGKVLKYSFVTTLGAAVLALILFITFHPVVDPNMATGDIVGPVGSASGYLESLMGIIPENFVEPFLEFNVLAVVFLAFFVSAGVLAMPEEQQKTLRELFASLFALVQKLTAFIITLMPLGIWAFSARFVPMFQEDQINTFKPLMGYLICVMAANLIHGFISLPLWLKFHGVPPWKSLRGMTQALGVAFFTRSSGAALPLTIRCSQENLGVSPRVSNFSLPICTVINMNACAAFILITVLFVSMSNGMVFSPLELFAWVFVATFAAIGNASVPMGCFFLSSALLTGMNMPLDILGTILPFYLVIDMFETAINVWSDACIATVVDKEVKEEEGILVAA